MSNHLKLTWKDVLDEKKWGCANGKAERAREAGYRYFVHNTYVWEQDVDGYRDIVPRILAKDII